MVSYKQKKITFTGTTSKPYLSKIFAKVVFVFDYVRKTIKVGAKTDPEICHAFRDLQGNKLVTQI